MDSQTQTIIKQNVQPGVKIPPLKCIKHFCICCQKSTTSANTLIANINYHQNSDIFTVNSNDQISEIPATLSPSKHETNTEHIMNIFPDSEALICLAGPTHLHKLNLNTNQLISSQKIVTAVGGHKL